MAKDLTFHSLCSTSTWNSLGLMPNTSNSYHYMWFRASCSTQMFHNSCVPQLLSQHKYKYSCPLDILAQHKHQIPMCSRAPRSTQNISSIMCFRAHAQNTKPYIKHMPFCLCPIYQTNHHVHVQWDLSPNIPIKISK